MLSIKETLHSELSRALNEKDIFQRNKLTPDYWQTQLLQLKSKRFLVLCSRQAGKTVTASAVAVQACSTLSNHQILILAPTERQAKEIIRTCKNLLAGAGYSNQAISETQLILEFQNGSRIIGLPSSRPENLRGFSAIDGLIFDEATFIADDLYTAISPMIATRPHAWQIHLSTPNGQQGHFYRQWIEDNDNWKRIKVPATECSRISKEFLEEQRRTMGDAIFAQEYLCEFNSDATRLLSPDLIARSFQPMGRLAA